MNWNVLLLTLLFVGSPGIALLESLCLQKTHLEVPVPGGLTKVGYARQSFISVEVLCNFLTVTCRLTMC
jgi:hypothetical protein